MPYSHGSQTAPEKNEVSEDASTPHLHAPGIRKLSLVRGPDSGAGAQATVAPAMDIGARAPTADYSSQRAVRVSVERSKRLVLQALARGMLLSLIVSLPVFVLWLDVQWLGNAVGEYSATELTQLGLLALTVVTFGVLARFSPDDRRFATLAAGFFACMLIRESDAALDMLVDGLWQALVIVVSVACLAFSLSDWRATLRGMARLVVSRFGLMMIIALAILLAYSRFLGMGALWKGLLGDEYIRVFKNAIEEGTELLGYVLIFVAGVGYASGRLRRLARKAHQSSRERLVPRRESYR